MISQRFLRGMRGSALPETAMIVSFTLTLMFGMFQIVAIGFLQVAGDAATFMAAHQFTIGTDTNAIATAEASMVPQMISTAIAYTPAPPPSVDPNLFSNIYGAFPLNNDNRTSGYTMVRPQNFQVYLNQQSGNGPIAAYQGIFPFTYTPISSGAVEGFYLMTQNEMDNFGTDPNSGLTGNILNTANAGPFLPQSDKTVANMNTPPYYLPTPIIQICSTPWNGASTKFEDTCANPEVWYLGLAEYLSNLNYAPSTLQMGIGPGQVFQAMAIHQRIYAQLTKAFPPLVAGGGYATQDAVLANIQAHFQDYNGTITSPSPSPGPGASWAPSTANFDNSGGTGVAVPIAYYDPLEYWSKGAGAGKPTLWTPRQMWSNETALLMDSGNDGVQGPTQWGGASFALVYEWDQPNFPPVNNNPGPGSYPISPLAGGESPGDPGY